MNSPVSQSIHDQTDHSTLPDSFLVNTNSFFDLLDYFILSRPCMKCFRDTVTLKVCWYKIFCNCCTQCVTKAGCSPSFNFKCLNVHCKWKYTWKSGGSWKGKFQQASMKVMLGFLLAGLTYENYVEVFHVTDLQPTCKNI